jgi:hypothetical protein
MRVVLPIFLILALFPTTASALDLWEDAGARYRRAPFCVGVQIAPFGSPVGLAGVVGDVALIPELSVMGGVGAGMASLQWALGLRPRWPISEFFALSATAAYSHGSYEEVGTINLGGGSQSWVYPNASWINLDLGADLRFGSGFALRPFLGVSKLVDSSTPWSRGEASGGLPDDKRKPTLPCTGIMAGWAF